MQTQTFTTDHHKMTKDAAHKRRCKHESDNLTLLAENVIFAQKQTMPIRKDLGGGNPLHPKTIQIPDIVKNIHRCEKCKEIVYGKPHKEKENG